VSTIPRVLPQLAGQSNSEFPSFDVTVLQKTGGPLTKRISLSLDGRLASDGSACVMSRGIARRHHIDHLTMFADLIGGLESDQAIALGSLRDDLPDSVAVATKGKRESLSEMARGHLIARTSDHIRYVPSRAALALIDVDTKGMPAHVRAQIDAAGGYWNALVSVIPQLATAGRVVRNSTSSGISRTDTGEKIAGSEGQHIFVLIADGADAERFLRTLHDRCWRAGLGWLDIGKAGQFLERSLVDRMVYAPERLVFEGAPILAESLVQDQMLRSPIVTDGPPLDTRAACPGLSVVETARVKGYKKEEAFRLGRRASDVKASFICEHAERIAERTGCPVTVAKRMVERQCVGVLLPSIELPFDAEEFRGKTVADVLADPDTFIGATLADPLEGEEYGRCKAKIMRRDDGTMWINSFAHGRTTYDLKRDAAAAQAFIDASNADKGVEPIVTMMAEADLTPEDEGALKDRIVARTGTKLRPINAMLKTAHERHEAARSRERATARAAANNDRRIALPAPAADAERLPILTALDEVLTSTGEDEPPMRGIDGHPIEVRDRPPSRMHELTAAGSNQTESAQTRLPPPTMPLLTAHDKYSLAHMFERHIRYEDENGVACALPPVFVDHYANYRDSALPCVSAVVTAPLVLANGKMWCPDGLDRDMQIVARIPDELRRLLPDGPPSAAQAARALDFLVNDWLCDVSTDFNGKCVLISMLMSILERVLLPERPAFFITAGKRGGGKTTAVMMAVYAATGVKPAADAWSSSEEERRKAMLANLADGVPVLVWDNMGLGATVSCKVLEAVLTSSEYSDRVLGETRKLTVPATTIMAFTGNNIGPRGDMASRSLVARLDVDRPDPENRPFRHPDPIIWTLDNRGKILRAVYTIMLANPRLQTGDRNVPTRFKTWMFLIGTAIESAAATLAEMRVAAPDKDRPATPVDFQDIFHGVEAEDEDGNGLAEVLELMGRKWTWTFESSEVARFINEHSNEEDAQTLRSFLDATGGRGGAVSTKGIGRRLAAICDAPVWSGSETLTLKRAAKTNAGKDAIRYYISAK
jgi:hypothetical protein